MRGLDNPVAELRRDVLTPARGSIQWQPNPGLRRTFGGSGSAISGRPADHPSRVAFGLPGITFPIGLDFDRSRPPMGKSKAGKLADAALALKGHTGFVLGVTATPDGTRPG